MSLISIDCLGVSGNALDHRFLTGGPWTPKGSVERVREDQKSKALYSFTPLLQELRGPPIVCNNTLGVRGNYFEF